MLTFEEWARRKKERADKYALAQEVRASLCNHCGRPLDPKVWRSEDHLQPHCTHHEQPWAIVLAAQVAKGIIGGPTDGGGQPTPLEKEDGFGS